MHDDRLRDGTAFREQLACLREVSHLFNEDFELDTVLQGVLDSARRLVGARCGFITVLDDQGQVRNIYNSGVNPEEDYNSWELPETMSTFASSGLFLEHLHSADLLEGPSPKDPAEFHLLPVVGEGKSLLASPVRYRGELLGAIYLVEKDSEEEFSQEDGQTLFILASHAAMAIANVRLETEVQQVQAELEATEDISFVNPATVTITVTDSDGDTATREVSVNVTNVDEPGMVTGLPAQPKEGVLMTVLLEDDPDGPVDGQDVTLTDNASTTWEWYRSRSRNSGWTLITATSTANMSTSTSTRTPESADVGYYLRATARYSDGQGDGKVAHGITTRTVQAKEYVNAAPVFRDDVPDVTGETATQGYQITMEVDEDDSLRRGDSVGQPIDDLVTDIGQNGSPEILTYTLTLGTEDGTAGANQTDFSIDRLTGQLSFSNTAGSAATDKLLDSENAAITDDRYLVRVKAIDPSSASSTALVTIQIMPVEEDPEFDPENKTADPAVNLAATSTAENTATTTALSSYVATDDEDGTTSVLKWTLEGVDKDKFALCNENISGDACTDLTAPGAPAATDDNTVTLRFKEEPNFEAPSDSGTNNVYNVTVVATDRDDGKSDYEVTVTVTNVDEPGTVRLSHIQPEVGASIRARLTDPDGGVSGTTWEWFWCTSIVVTSRECDSPTKINTTSSTYTPISNGRFLQAVATYTDRTSSNSQDKRAATTTSAYRVQEEDTDNQPPVLPDVPQTFNIVESCPEDTTNCSTGTLVGTVAATDPDDGNLLYTLTGTDAALFVVASIDDPDVVDVATTTAGQISLKSGTELDYETKKTYRVTVTATDPSLARDTVAVIIEVTNVNEPPTVSQRGLTVTGPASVSYAEDRTDAVETYRAVGPDASGASWSLTGPDTNAFSIPAGALTFNTQPDFEATVSADGDDVYSVTIRVRSGDFEDDLPVTVTVTNVDEPGTVSITPATQPRVGTELTASLTDEDGAPTGESWQWARSTSDTGPWSDISGATSAAYTPVEADVDNYLRARASYTDPQGSGKSAEAVTSATVVGVTATPNDGTVAVSPAQPVVGTAMTASLTDADTGRTGLTWQWAWSTGSSATGNWTDISNATSASYTPVDGDVGRYLRATATYTDSDGPNQTASGISASAVQAATQAVHRYDRNANGRIEREEVIAAINDFLFGGGTTTRAEVIEVINLYLFPPQS